MILLRAYLRRKRFEARLLAAEVGKLLAGSSGRAQGKDRVSADEVMAMMGASF